MALDGEVLKLPTPLTFRSRPAAIRLIVPPADEGEVGEGEVVAGEVVAGEVVAGEVVAGEAAPR